MNLKSAAFLALIGVGIVTILQVVHSVSDLSNGIAGLIPMMTALMSLLYAFAAITVTIFLWAFHKAQA